MTRSEPDTSTTPEPAPSPAGRLVWSRLRDESDGALANDLAAGLSALPPQPADAPTLLIRRARALVDPSRRTTGAGRPLSHGLRLAIAASLLMAATLGFEAGSRSDTATTWFAAYEVSAADDPLLAALPGLDE
ncbi:MAG: hypothetical protein RIE31_04645 [Alphaproteobacteria bacterium]